MIIVKEILLFNIGERRNFYYHKNVKNILNNYQIN